MSTTAEKMADVYARLYGAPGTQQWGATMQRMARTLHNRRRREVVARDGRDIGGYRPRRPAAD